MSSGQELTDRREQADPPPALRTWIRLRNVLLAVGGTLALLNIGLYAYGLTLPDDWRVERSILIDASPAAVYPLIASPQRWAEWSPWTLERDPTLSFHYSGPAAGEAASVSWIGRELGTGAVTLTAADPGRSVGYSLELQGQPFSAAGRFALEPTGGRTRVVWSDAGKLEGTVGRLFGSRMEQIVGADFDAALLRLKAVAERPRP